MSVNLRESGLGETGAAETPIHAHERIFTAIGEIVFQVWIWSPMRVHERQSS